jgi:hypothetical protein
MMSKLIPAALILALIVGLGQVVICKDDPGSGPEPPAKKPAGTKKKEWNGRAQRDFNLTFGLVPQSLTIDRVVFSNLNSKKTARVKVFITSGSGRAKWTKERRRGWGYRPQVQARYSGAYQPKIIRQRSGTKTLFQLVYKNIPVGALGPLCGQRRTTARYPLYLIFPGLPGPLREVKISAPPAPVGACLGQGVKAKININKRIKYQGKKGKKKKITVFGSVSGANPKRVVVRLSKPGFVSQPRPRVNNRRFKVKFRVPRGKYQLRAGLKAGKWLDKKTIVVKK